MKKIGEELTEVFQLTEDELNLVSGTEYEVKSSMSELIKRFYQANQVLVVDIRIWPTEGQALVKFRMTKDY